MLNRTLQNRIERAEQAARADERFPTQCTCFPAKKQPFVGCPVEIEIAAAVKCPLHGDRFDREYFVYVSKWLRVKLWRHLWTHRSEQYRRAWFASFPASLWPAEEEETDDGRLFLRLKDGTKLRATGSLNDSQ
jgi:hypothetical protein